MGLDGCRAKLKSGLQLREVAMEGVRVGLDGCRANLQRGLQLSEVAMEGGEGWCWMDLPRV